MGKNPADQFYWADYLRDTRALSLAAKGAWMDLLCSMWYAPEQGRLSMPVDGYARIWSVSTAEAHKILTELVRLNICDCNYEYHEIKDSFDDDIEIINRRMWREYKNKDSNRARQARFREKGGGDPKRWTAIRINILERDEYMCAYCGRRADTVDHILPRKQGGDEAPSNLVACCKRCNHVKNNNTPQEAGMSFWKGFDIDKLNHDEKEITSQKHQDNTDITPPSSSLHSSPSSEPPIVPQGGQQKKKSEPEPDEPEKDFIWARSGKRKRKLTGWKLDDFLSFWQAYAYPHGRAEAADAWLEIDDLTHEMVEAKIIPAAKREASGRAALKAKGLTPKMAQGWLNARRFDDEPPKNGKSSWDRGVFR